MKFLIPAVIVTLISLPVTLVMWLLVRIGIYMSNRTDPEAEESKGHTTLYSPGKNW